MREIVLDTETTGIDHRNNDRVVEIGCVELMHSVPTGRVYHAYINPERNIPAAAFAVHGLSAEFLRDQPKFIEVGHEFLRFIGKDHLIAHNATFDIGFLNSELTRIRSSLKISYDRVVDTLPLARKKHPGASNSLDALCSRYKIDSSHRSVHGALLDAEILAEIYIELIGGRQTGLDLFLKKDVDAIVAPHDYGQRSITIRLTDIELAKHEKFIETLGGDVIWRGYTKVC